MPTWLGAAGLDVLADAKVHLEDFAVDRSDDLQSLHRGARLITTRDRRLQLRVRDEDVLTAPGPTCALSRTCAQRRQSIGVGSASRAFDLVDRRAATTSRRLEPRQHAL